MNANPSIALLFSARIIRLFAFGFMSVILVLFLSEAGLSDREIGILLTLTLGGDVLLSFWVTKQADRTGRRKMLVFGALLMAVSGLAFAVTRNPHVLTCAAIIGVISPSGNEIGPFLSIEQAALSQLIAPGKRTAVFGWYNLAGSFATALGALSGGHLSRLLQDWGHTAFDSYRLIMAGYAVCGVMLVLVFVRLNKDVEVLMPPPDSGSGPGPLNKKRGLHRSRPVVFRLSALFALDAFAGGFVVQSIMVYWFHARFGVDEGVLGSVFFGANILAGVSALLATRIAARFGLINTMVFTHIPSNVLLCLVPLMPGLGSAVTVLLIRFSISQMDVPTRQSYTMAVVDPDERTFASGVTNIARTLGAALSPAFSGFLLASPALFSVPFFLAGGLKIVYDISLYAMFQHVRPPEESVKTSENERPSLNHVSQDKP